jgi:hypothetical protein
VKLTDSQLVILSAAARRDGGTILPLPKSVKLNKGSATLVLKSLLKHKLVTEHGAASGAEAWREEKNGDRFALSISAAGLQTIGVEPEATSKFDAAAEKSGRRARKPDAETDGASRKGRNAVLPRKGTKLSQLIELLQRKTGATIEEAAKATGWQHHSVRGAISGALKKKLGLVVTSSATDGRGRVYRIAAQR